MSLLLAISPLLLLIAGTTVIGLSDYYKEEKHRPESFKDRRLIEAIKNKDELLIKHLMDNRETVVEGISFFEYSTNVAASFDCHEAVPLKYSIYDHIIYNKYMTPGEILLFVISKSGRSRSSIERTDDIIQYLLDKGAKVDKEAWTHMPSGSIGRKLLLEAYENQNETPKFPSK